METNGGNYSEWLDRIEGIIEAMATHLTAQVVLTDRVDRIAHGRPTPQ